MTKTVAHANNQTLLLFLWKSLGKRLKTNWVNQRGEREGVGGKEDKRGERQKNKGGELERRKRTNRRGGQ